MSQALTPHPDTPCPAVRRLEAAARRTGSGLALRYVLAGDLGGLAIPPAAAAARADGLWAHTCFEAFLGGDGEAYLEFNFSPSGQWAAYRFDGYRQGMAPLEMAPPRIEVTRSNGVLELTAEITLDLEGPLRVGLTAVVETASGAVSYWALQHPAGEPDFHHDAGRVLTA